MSIRTRFAPSPTGHVHIGNIRAAIFNWLFARHEGGQFLLRIEDTDRERSTPEAVQTVVGAMQWLGLTWDEPPVYQSTQKARHLEAAETLLRKGLAYREDKGGTGQGECIVFRMPGTDMAYHDEIKGDLRKEAKDMKDLVIVRSNGEPVFHLANVVDDITMGITHIIRGDDHVENTYRHVALFQALGAPIPKYAHLPMIVNAQGKPYSKRDGAAYAGEFRDKGFLPEALFNFLALLGWSPGEDREVMTRDEMVRLFTLDRVKSAPAQMDMKKFEWMNAEYMRAMPLDGFKAGFKQALAQAGLWQEGAPEEYLDRVIALMRPRTAIFTAVPAAAGFFFREDYPFDEKAVQKRLLKGNALQELAATRDRFAALPTHAAAALEEALQKLAAERGVAAGDLIHPVRVAVSGLAGGPGLFEMLEVLGRERVLERIGKVLRQHGAA